MARYHDRADLGLDFLEHAEHLQAVHIGKPEIDQGGVDGSLGFPPDQADCLLPAGGPLDLVTGFAKYPRERPAQRFVVVYDENAAAGIPFHQVRRLCSGAAPGPWL